MAKSDPKKEKNNSTDDKNNTTDESSKVKETQNDRNNEIINNISGELIDVVISNPNYVQCLLHIKSYRDYHKGEKEEFNERIEVLDERYKRYNRRIDYIQITIIILSAGTAFIQAGNIMFNISEEVLRFIGLCVSAWTALALSISKYQKLDEQKESMNNLRQQCSELVSELGAREDRLNTLCSKEIWAGPIDGPISPAVTAWENERDEMYNSLKSIIQKKQSLVAAFDHIMDTHESKKLILAAKARSLEYKESKLTLDLQILAYTLKHTDYSRKKHNLGLYHYEKKNDKPLSDMSNIQRNGLFNNARSTGPPLSHYNFSQQNKRNYYERPDRNDMYYEDNAPTLPDISRSSPGLNDGRNMRRFGVTYQHNSFIDRHRPIDIDNEQSYNHTRKTNDVTEQQIKEDIEEGKYNMASQSKENITTHNSDKK